MPTFQSWASPKPCPLERRPSRAGRPGNCGCCSTRCKRHPPEGARLPESTTRQSPHRLRPARPWVWEARAAVDAALYADQPVGILSGGEQRRLLIAQALLTEPKLLLFDEPLASLDLRSQHEIVHLVDNLRRERSISVLFVAHDLNPL